MRSKLQRTIQDIKNSPYMERIKANNWIPLFILLLNTFIGIYYLSKAGSFTGEQSIMGIGLILIKTLFRATLWASLIWWICAAPKGKKISWLITSFLLSLVVILHFFESFLINLYGMYYSHPIILAIAGTNHQEASEYWTANFSLLPLVRPTIELAIAIAITHMYNNLRTRKPTIPYKKYSYHWYAYLLSIFLVLTNLLGTLPRTYSWVMNFGMAYDQTISPMDRLLWNSIGFMHETNKIHASMDNMKKLDLGELCVENTLGNHTIVIIIGETLRRDYMHCYGYPLSNTPHLDSLIEEGGFIMYTNVVSPAASTSESLTRVLTTAMLDRPTPWYESPAINMILSKAGYETAWTSNQESTGAIVQAVNIIASLSDHIKYVNARSIDGDRDTRAANYDEDVLPCLLHNQGERKGNVSEKLAQFIHLEGSHPLYNKRFPKSYARFASKDIPMSIGTDEKQVVADYVNSVYYNDYVVSEIIKQYKNEKALIIYFSDHGQVLYDDPSNPSYAGHGRTIGGMSIPFLVYLTPSMRTEHPELYNKVLAAKDRCIMNDLFTHSLCELLGIKMKYSDDSLSFFSPGYNESRPRSIDNLGKLNVL